MAVYPAFMYLAGLLFKRKNGHVYDVYPMVSVLVAARNEEKCIGLRIENLLQQDYPADRYEILVASDVSGDGTDEIVRSFAERGVRFLRSETRKGKSALMVELSKTAKGEILVFTDANTMFRENTVRELVEPFADPGVGCVDGSKQNSLDNTTCESVYWRYEQLLKGLGSKLGAVLGATGAVFAVRKSLYRPADPSRADDFETAVLTRVQGFACLYNPRAIAAEPTPDDTSQYHRLVRIVSWMIASAFSLLGRALRNGRIGLAMQLLIHKLLRWVMGVFAILASVAGLLTGFFDGYMNPIFLSVAAFNLLAIAGMFLGSGVPSLFRLPYFFWLMCTASLSGVMKAVRARSAAIWDHSAR